MHKWKTHAAHEQTPIMQSSIRCKKTHTTPIVINIDIYLPILLNFCLYKSLHQAWENNNNTTNLAIWTPQVCAVYARIVFSIQFRITHVWLRDHTPTPHHNTPVWVCHCSMRTPANACDTQSTPFPPFYCLAISLCFLLGFLPRKCFRKTRLVEVKSNLPENAHYT